MNRIVLKALLIATGIVATGSSFGQSQADWLTGTWTLCEDPDNSPKESLRFNPDGTGQVIRTKGNIEFLHRHSGEKVSLLAHVKDYAIPIEMTASPEHDKLFQYSDRTKNTAIYVRSDSKQLASCTIM